MVVDAPTGGGIGGSGSGGTLQSDCEVAAEHLVALGCVPPPVEEFVAVCMEPTPATCAAEYEAWRACFAADIAEVTSCFGDGSSPPSCNSAYCTYCECSGPCQDPSCQ